VDLPARLGSYEPLTRLASGGMASLYIARHAGAGGFERLVVIKRVHRHLLGNREFCDMFRDEGRISSLIRHSNVVSVIDIAEESGELFLVLDYIESLSLAQLLAAANASGELLSAPVVSRILSDALAGLHAAHEALDMRGVSMDVVHRDVSPHNILVDTHGVSSIIDFGIAKAASRLATTSSGQFKGKFRYMAPEQVRQQTLDRRADLFSAGVVLYEALTGRCLFRGDSEGDTALSVLVTEIPDPSSIAPGVSPELDAVAHEALERRRDQRFPTAARFREALEAACPPASTDEVAAVVARLGGETLAGRREELQQALARSSTVSPSKHDGRRRIALSLIGLLAVGGSAIAIIVQSHHLVHGRRPPYPSAMAPAGPPTVAHTAAAETTGAPTVVDTAIERSTAQPTRRPRPPVPAPPLVDLHRRNPYGSP
jgi:eukaryotic-like serine/threonine-protein kinase